MRSHQWIDQRSLAFDQAIARKLRSDPSLLRRPLANVERWLKQRQPAPPPALLEWHEILRCWPFDRILDLLTATDEKARRLRQSSPFCGILTPQERRDILKDYESRRT